MTIADGVLVPANGCPPIIGVSESLRRAVNLAQRFAEAGLSILVCGATGTGKELLAQHIHHWSGRRGPFIDVNCAGLPVDLVDGWLFGHRKNAFTGAGEAAAGLIEAAAGGTLFLDEACSLPLDAQAKLLRVLETKEVRRVMDVAKRTLSFGVVAAAQNELREAIEGGRFRRDLYQRLAAGVVRLPDLGERPADLMPLALHFATAHGRTLAHGTETVLERYPWPGNVRELSTVIGRATLLDAAVSIPPSVIAEAIALGALPGGRGDPSRPGEDDRRRAETLAALEESAWKVGRAAQRLGIHRVTLYRRARRFGIHLGRARE